MVLDPRRIIRWRRGRNPEERWRSGEGVAMRETITKSMALQWVVGLGGSAIALLGAIAFGLALYIVNGRHEAQQSYNARVTALLEGLSDRITVTDRKIDVITPRVETHDREIERLRNIVTAR